MSYNKTTWTAGDTITAEKLNNIEDGIEAAEAQSTTLCEITTTNPASAQATIHFQYMVLVNKDNSNLVYDESDSIPDGTSYCIPGKQKDNYAYSISVAGTGIYSVTINNTSVEYNAKEGAYLYDWSDISYPESISIVIVSNIH